MQIIAWDELLKRNKAEHQAVTLTIGVFDGLHPGHRQLLDIVRQRKPGIFSVVVTFRDNPAFLFTRNGYPGNINSFAQKVRNFQLNDVDILVCIDFSLEFSKMTGRDFLDSLSRKFEIRKIVVGRDFRFGSGGSTTAGDLPAFLPGCDVVVISPVVYQNITISSTIIREWIITGDFHKVNQLLFREYALDIRGVKKKGDDFILKRAVRQVIPEPGQYRVRFEPGKPSREGVIKIDDESLGFIEPGGIYRENIEEIIFIEKA